MTSIRITLLMDHQASSPALETEHGLSLYLEAPSLKLLFDTGASEGALQNAKKMGLPFHETRHIVISHGHNDHTGGLRAFLDVMNQAEIYLHPKALFPKYSMRAGQVHELSLSEGARKKLKRHPGKVHWVTAPTLIEPWVGLTGPIPRLIANEAKVEGFYNDPAGLHADAIEDDQALWIKTGKGLLVILGCAHSGVLNTLYHVIHQAKEKKVFALVGGLHLSRASWEEIQVLIRYLREMGVERVVPLHCTGPAAVNAFIEAFGEQGRPIQVGESLVFES